jgi:hypothetical protein
VRNIGRRFRPESVRNIGHRFRPESVRNIGCQKKLRQLRAMLTLETTRTFQKNAATNLD